MEKSVSYLLTAEMAKKAVDMARPAILAAMESGMFKRKALHIVVMNPATRPWQVENEEDAILYEESFGDPATWETHYDEIARAKAIESWRYDLPTHVIRETMPYLLQANEDRSDTMYWGSAYLLGLVVAGSGVQPCYDEWSGYMVAAGCRALCIEKMQKMLENKERDFVWQRELDGHNGDSR
jgi:hypothetical protein